MKRPILTTDENRCIRSLFRSFTGGPVPHSPNKQMPELRTGVTGTSNTHTHPGDFIPFPFIALSKF